MPSSRASGMDEIALERDPLRGSASAMLHDGTTAYGRLWHDLPEDRLEATRDRAHLKGGFSI